MIFLLVDEPFQADRYYSLAHIARVFDVHVRTVRRELERAPELRAAVVRKFSTEYLPGAVLAAWAKRPCVMPQRVRDEAGGFVAAADVDVVTARTPGELHRRLSKRLEVANG